MNLSEKSFFFEKLLNGLGNQYLTDNFITEPFDFKVKIRYGKQDEYNYYVTEIYSIPDFPKSFQYKPEIIEKENKWVDGVHISVIINEFKELFKYIDFKSDVGIVFMNQENK